MSRRTRFTALGLILGLLACAPAAKSDLTQEEAETLKLSLHTDEEAQKDARYFHSVACRAHFNNLAPDELAPAQRFLIRYKNKYGSKYRLGSNPKQARELQYADYVEILSKHLGARDAGTAQASDIPAMPEALLEGCDNDRLFNQSKKAVEPAPDLVDPESHVKALLYP